MKKLTMLKPDRRKVYLNNGRGQEVDYLYISPKLTKKALEKDVKAGAVQFKDCLEFLNKKPSRVVLVECGNEEEGMMAVSYLAGAYNWEDGINSPWIENEDVDVNPYDGAETQSEVE